MTAPKIPHRPPFDLATALLGAAVVTRAGNPVTNIHQPKYANLPYVIAGRTILKGETAHLLWTTTGAFYHISPPVPSDLDLFMAETSEK